MSNIEKRNPSTEATIEGIKVSDWHWFIDKNASRYVDVFSENEGKKVFFHMNWAAAFFNFYWMFYRKMYKYAFLYLLISSILSIAVTLTTVAVTQPAMLEAEEIIAPYTQYLDQDHNLKTGYTEGMVDFTAIQNAVDEYKTVEWSVKAKATFGIIVPTVMFNLLFGLLADCIYRRYILKNMRYKSGGTSGWSIVGGLVLYPLINNLVVGPLSSFIAAMFEL